MLTVMALQMVSEVALVYSCLQKVVLGVVMSVVLDIVLDPARNSRMPELELDIDLRLENLRISFVAACALVVGIP